MRNINELIGIIKGINFDGIINDREVVRLQTWLNKNRNLAFEPRQTELIWLLDKVLEDKSYGTSLNYGRTVGKETCILVSDPKTNRRERIYWCC